MRRGEEEGEKEGGKEEGGKEGEDEEKGGEGRRRRREGREGGGGEGEDALLPLLVKFCLISLNQACSRLLKFCLKIQRMRMKIE